MCFNFTPALFFLFYLSFSKTAFFHYKYYIDHNFQITKCKMILQKAVGRCYNHYHHSKSKNEMTAISHSQYIEVAEHMLMLLD